MSGPDPGNNNNDDHRLKREEFRPNAVGGIEMVDLLWVWVAAGGGVAVGMFLFALMAMAGDRRDDDLVASSTPDALT